MTVPVPHRELFPAAGAEGGVLIVAVTGVLDEERHPEVMFLASAW